MLIMTLTQARVRARLNSASGSSSSDGGPPAAATVPVEDFKSWKEKASGGTVRRSPVFATNVVVPGTAAQPLFLCFCYLGAFSKWLTCCCLPVCDLQPQAAECAAAYLSP